MERKVFNFLLRNEDNINIIIAFYENFKENFDQFKENEDVFVIRALIKRYLSHSSSKIRLSNLEILNLYGFDKFCDDYELFTTVSDVATTEYEFLDEDIKKYCVLNWLQLTNTDIPDELWGAVLVPSLNILLKMEDKGFMGKVGQCILKVLDKIDVDKVFPGTIVKVRQFLNKSSIYVFPFDILCCLFEKSRKPIEKQGVDFIYNTFIDILIKDKYPIKGRAKLAEVIVRRYSDSLKDIIPYCIRCLFEYTSNPDNNDERLLESIIEISKGVIISSEFNSLVNDINMSKNESNTCFLIRTLHGWMKVNADNEEFKYQIDASLLAIVDALIYCSQIRCESKDVVVYENGEFLKTDRLYINECINEFDSIVGYLPVCFFEIIFELLQKFSNDTAEIFYICYVYLKRNTYFVSRDYKISLILILEEPQWWRLSQDNPKSYLALEFLFRVLSVIDRELLQEHVYPVFLYNILEHVVVGSNGVFAGDRVSTTGDTLLKEWSNGNISKLLKDNADHIVDRVLAKLHFIEHNPNIVNVIETLFAFDDVDSLLQTHLLPKLFDTMDLYPKYQESIICSLNKIRINPQISADSVKRLLNFVPSRNTTISSLAIQTIGGIINEWGEEENLHLVSEFVELLSKLDAFKNENTIRVISKLRPTHFLRCKVTPLLDKFLSLLDDENSMKPAMQALTIYLDESFELEKELLDKVFDIISRNCLVDDATNLIRKLFKCNPSYIIYLLRSQLKLVSKFKIDMAEYLKNLIKELYINSPSLLVEPENRLDNILSI